MAEWMAYRFVLANRMRKKLKLHYEAFRLLIDKTTAFYILLLVGYILFALVRQRPDFAFLNDLQLPITESLLVILPVRYIFSSFTSPGIVFSSSEHSLTRLPLRLPRIWLFAALFERGRRILLYAAIGTLVILFTPLGAEEVTGYFGIFILYDLLMLLPQWKLYQQRIWLKIAFLLLVSAWSGAVLLTGMKWAGSATAAVCLAVALLFLKRTFRNVDWSRVAESGDFKVWNMALLGAASKVKMRPRRKYKPRINAHKKRAPFLNERQLYRRLWLLYFRKNSALLTQSIVVLFLMLTVLQWMPRWVYHLGMGAGLYAFASIAAVVFGDRLRTDIIQTLPWNLDAYRKSFRSLVALVGAVLLLPMLAFYWRTGGVSSVPALLLIIGAGGYMVEIQLDKACRVLANDSTVMRFGQDLTAVFIVCIIFMAKLPWLALACVPTCVLWWRRRR